VHDGMARTLFASLFNGDTAKGFILSTIAGTVMFFGHWFFSDHDQQNLLDQHTVQLSALKATVDETSKAIQQLVITTTRTDGKLDTLNQKIDDDRRQSKIEASDRRGRN
jgi:hypothetical protein